MLIYIKTPHYQNSKHLPHLVEHCVVHQIGNNINNFLNHSYDIEGDSFAMYTVFFVPNHFDIDQFITNITKAITPQTIKYEQKIIKKEMEYYSYHQKLYENASGQIYDKKINNTTPSQITVQEAIDYHAKYYQPDNMIICDDNFNIITNKCKKLKLYNKKTEFDYNIIKKTIKSSYIKTNLIFKKYNNRQDYYFMFFLEVLLETWWSYIHRQKGEIYNYEHQLLALMPQHILLSTPNSNNTNINEDFFQEYKKYFLKILKLDYAKKGIIINALVINQYVEETEIINFINEIKYDKIEEILTF